MVFYIIQKRGNCLCADCYLCPVDKCTIFTMGQGRCTAKTAAAISLIRAKHKSGAIEIQKEFKEKE